MRTLGVLLEKEFKQFLRDPFLPRMIVIFPVIIMLIIPLVANFDFKNINIGIIDNDNSSFSRLFIDKVNHSTYFRLKAMPKSFDNAMEAMDQNDVDIILEIPRDFEKELGNGLRPELSITANAVDASKGSAGSGYLTQILLSTIQDKLGEKGAAVNATELITVRNLYNETENYRYFMIPALMVMLIIIVCSALPTLNIVKEKEQGTIEQINVTPVNKLTFTFGKLIPYWIMGQFILTIALLIAKYIYGLSPVGPVWIIYLNSLIFTFVISSFGQIISNISSSMQQAMFVMFFFIMVFILMSGLLTPIESMPEWAQMIAVFIPPKYFIEVMRAVYLKGSGFLDVYPSFIYLGCFTIVFTFFAVLSYKKRI